MTRPVPLGFQMLLNPTSHPAVSAASLAHVVACLVQDTRSSSAHRRGAANFHNIALCTALKHRFCADVK
eukprot:5680541-Karenia_brevis.AAC.1